MGKKLSGNTTGHTPTYQSRWAMPTRGSADIGASWGGGYLLALGLQGQLQQSCGQCGAVEQRHSGGCTQEACGEIGNGPRGLAGTSQPSVPQHRSTSPRSTWIGVVLFLLKRPQLRGKPGMGGVPLTLLTPCTALQQGVQQQLQ